MRAINHILVIVDPTTGTQHCVQKGASLALATGATLELFICDFASDLRPSRFAIDEVYEVALARRRSQLDAQLESLAEPLRQAGVQVQTDCSFQSSLHGGVLGKVRACIADLVVKDTHYHGPSRRALFTNSDWHLIRECAVPLLLTKTATWPSRLRVAAALDPGHADDKPARLDHELVEVAESLAACMDGEAWAVHVFNPLPGIATLPPAGIGCGSAVPADLLDGVPAVVLPQYAVQKDIDVLVTGAVSRSVTQRFLVGGTAERLLDRLPCDILVVKPTRAPNGQQAARSAA